MGETPGLDNPPPGSGDPRKRRRRRGALLLAMALVLVVTITIVLIQSAPIGDRIQQWAGGTPAAEDSTEPEAGVQPDLALPIEPDAQRPLAAEGSARDDDEDTRLEQGLPRERIVSDPDQIDTELARLVAEQAREESKPETTTGPEGRRIPSPRTTVVAESPSREQQLAVDPRDTERMERLLRAREARLAEAEAGSRARSVGREPAADAEASEQSAERWSPSAAEYVRVWELPLSIRRNLPELRLSIHVFAVEEEQRFVLVNGERFVTGDMISNNVRLVEIRREGAVVDFRDYRFLLEP